MSILVNRLKSLSDIGRLRSLALIAACGELCVCEIQKVLVVTVSTASRNLGELEAAGWLVSRRDGRWMHYSLAELDPEWENFRRDILHLFRATAVAKGDLERRRALQSSSGGSICGTSADRDSKSGLGVRTLSAIET